MGIDLAARGAVPDRLPHARAAAVRQCFDAFSDPVKLSEVLFSSYVLPFEVTSVLLLVAMIGAIVLSRRRSERADKPRPAAGGETAKPAGQNLEPVEADKPRPKENLAVEGGQDAAH